MQCNELKRKTAIFKEIQLMQWVDEKGSVITKGTQYHRRVRPDGKLIDTNFTYTFTPTRHHNGRTLTCQVFSPALNTALTTEAVIRVKYPPYVQLVFSPTKLKEGEEAFVTCKVDANPNNVTYRWFREGKEVLGVAGATMPLGVLSRSNQSATIACEVTNALGTARKTDQLNILYPPMFLAEPSSVSGEIGNMVTMKCRVDANPVAEIYWSRLRDNELVGKGEELTIEASKATAGVYVCSARSETFPPLDAQLHLRLRGPPRIKTPAVLVVREGQNAVLRCSVVSVPHPVSLAWEKGGVSLSPDGDWEVKEDQRADGVVSTLTIFNVSQDDYASYNCTVINEYGVGTQQVILQRPPLIPFMVIVGGGGGSCSSSSSSSSSSCADAGRRSGRRRLPTPPRKAPSPTASAASTTRAKTSTEEEASSSPRRRRCCRTSSRRTLAPRARTRTTRKRGREPTRPCLMASESPTAAGRRIALIVRVNGS
nr:irregular chiasm C-roughest protein-like [Penaeus vannamei]